MNKYFCVPGFSQRTILFKKIITKLWARENYSNLLMKNKKMYKILKDVSMLDLTYLLNVHPSQMRNS